MTNEEQIAYDLAVENHERAMARVAELERELERFTSQLKALSDPEAVLVNMMRGAIARPSVRGFSKLFGEVVNGEDAQQLEIARLRAELAALKAQPGGVVLPNRCEIRNMSDIEDAWKSGWNACIKEVARLNQQPASGGEYGDAYQGAREDLAIWKRRALEAEQQVREKDQIIDHLTLEAQGESRFGEPAVSGGVDERAAFEAWCSEEMGVPAADVIGAEGDDLSAAFSAGASWQARAALAQSERVPELPPFARKVISKLERFEECASDSDAGGVDIGRHWLDLLTQLGLLNRVQRSPGLWEISQQGEDLLAAAPSPSKQGGV